MSFEWKALVIADKGFHFIENRSKKGFYITLIE